MIRDAYSLMFAAALTLTASGASAQTRSRIDPSILAVDNSVSVAYEASSVYYIEPDNGQIGSGYNDSEKGDIKGGAGGFSYMNGDGGFVQAQYMGEEGKLNYDGFLIGGPPYTPVNGTSRATVQEFDAKGGWAFPVAEHWVLAPYVAGGRRYWVRELGLGTANDYNESYSFGYLALGNKIQYAPRKKLVLTFDGMFGRMLDASVNVPTAGLNTTALGPGPVIRVAAEADWKIWRWLHGFVGADYTYFNFWQSATQASGYLEPVSRTELYSATAGLRLSFRDP